MANTATSRPRIEFDMVTSSGDFFGEQAKARSRANGHRPTYGLGPPGPRRRSRKIVVIALVLGFLGWLVISQEPSRQIARSVDRVEFIDNARSAVLLLGWEADRCERLHASSSATVEGSRLVLDVTTWADANCMAQRPIGGEGPTQRWRMLEAIVLKGDLADLDEQLAPIQVACQRNDVVGCNKRVELVF